MSARESLVSRPDVPDADVDDILEIAARRQDEARKAAEGATREEIEAVARELDIAPEHIEGAIEELRRRRAEEATARVEAAREQEKAGKALRRAAIGALAAIGLVVLLVLGAGWTGGARVDAARAAASSAQAPLDAALSRQASLAPQLAGLAGADGAGLAPLQAAVRDAGDLPARLAAADALAAEMAARLGALPPPASEAEATLRLQLHDEVTGSQNRVATELRRYREAETAWRAAAETPTGKLAVRLGFADAP